MKVVVFILFLGILLSFDADALAVVSDFLENDTFLLEDGASKLYGIRLQNSAPVEASFSLTYDDTIAKVIDYEEVYTIEAKTSKAIFFNISAPKKSRHGDEYRVGYTIHELSGSGPGVPILLKISKSFNVKIIRKPEKFYIEDYSYAAYIVIALALLSYIFRKDIKSKWKKMNKGMPKKRLGKRKIIK